MTSIGHGPRRPRIALLGCGTVGSEVARQLLFRGHDLGAQLTAVLVRDASRARPVPRNLLFTDFESILAQRPDVVVEVIGGLHPAGEFVWRSLRAGVPVITANKTLIARRGAELHRLAADRAAPLRYEAAVCAGVPVLAALEQLRGDRIISIRAVLNGTCNYILSRLAAGEPFDRVLAQAQAKGLAEPDPTADISGRDTLEKLCILAAAAGLGPLNPEAVPCQGIASITPGDLALARRARSTIKLLAEIDAADSSRPHAQVGPARIPLSHPLAALDGPENAVLIHAELAGHILFKGPGAGPGPTAAAILGDLAQVLSTLRAARRAEPASARPAPAHQPGAAGQAPRPHLIRARPALQPDQIFEALRSQRANPREIHIDRFQTCATADLLPSQAQALARALPGSGLAMPILTE
jgi:homoserine dehydrogenase